MESFIRETSEIIVNCLSSNNVLDALHCNSIITKEEYDNITSLNTINNRCKLVEVLRTK